MRRCIAAATESAAAVERWRMQRRTLERLPSDLAEPLFRLLLARRLLTPSLLEYAFLLFQLRLFLFTVLFSNPEF